MSIMTGIMTRNIRSSSSSKGYIGITPCHRACFGHCPTAMPTTTTSSYPSSTHDGVRGVVEVGCFEISEKGSKSEGCLRIHTSKGPAAGDVGEESLHRRDETA